MDSNAVRTVQSSNYIITIGGIWSLNDFYELPHVFEQAYVFNCAVFQVEMTTTFERLNEVFLSYPWRGGYSAVNFYNSLGKHIPAHFRAKIKSIQYASPGGIELIVVIPAVVAIAKLVDIIVKSAGGVNSAALKVQVQHIQKG
jgi:hypothetical protein